MAKKKTESVKQYAFFVHAATEPEIYSVVHDWRMDNGVYVGIFMGKDKAEAADGFWKFVDGLDAFANVKEAFCFEIRGRSSYFTRPKEVEDEE